MLSMGKWARNIRATENEPKGITEKITEVWSLRGYLRPQIKVIFKGNGVEQSNFI